MGTRRAASAAAIARPTCGSFEKDGLISSEKIGRVRTCRLNAERLASAESWLSEQSALWQARTDRLANYVEAQMSRSIDDAD
jgi:hypothetical protein